jgi:hypothetical protein
MIKRVFESFPAIFFLSKSKFLTISYLLTKNFIK